MWNDKCDAYRILCLWLAGLGLHQCRYWVEVQRHANDRRERHISCTHSGSHAAHTHTNIKYTSYDTNRTLIKHNHCTRLTNPRPHCRCWIRNSLRSALQMCTCHDTVMPYLRIKWSFCVHHSSDFQCFWVRRITPKIAACHDDFDPI